MGQNNVYKCASCQMGAKIPCISNEPVQCTAGRAVWCSADDYKITKKPEPVYVLDIPDQLQYVVKGHLWRGCGLKVKIIGPIGNDYTAIETNTGRHTIRSDWLKQKQPEPTREELQERIDEINEYIVSCNTMSAVNMKNLSAIANGKK